MRLSEDIWTNEHAELNAVFMSALRLIISCLNIVAICCSFFLSASHKKRSAVRSKPYNSGSDVGQALPSSGEIVALQNALCKGFFEDLQKTFLVPQTHIFTLNSIGYNNDN